MKISRDELRELIRETTSNKVHEEEVVEPAQLARGQESKGAIIQEMIPLLRDAAKDPNVTSQEVSVLKQLVTFFTNKARQADLLKSFNLIKRSFDNISKDLEKQIATQAGPGTAQPPPPQTTPPPGATAVNEVRDYLLTAPPPFKNQKARGNK